jgi:hypothetical protein
MPNYRLCWQHLADEYCAIVKVAEANRGRGPCTIAIFCRAKTGGNKEL